MAKYDVNKDSTLSDGLIALRRHLRSCAECISARKRGEPRQICEYGLRMVLYAADHYESIIRLRVAAHNSGENIVYACPDTSRHGKAYPLVALPLVVTGFQDRLI